MRIATFAINRFANIKYSRIPYVVQGRHSQLLDVAILKTQSLNCAINTRPTVIIFLGSLHAIFHPHPQYLATSEPLVTMFEHQ